MSDFVTKYRPLAAKAAAYTAYGAFIALCLAIFYLQLVFDLTLTAFAIAYDSILTVSRLTEAYRQPEFTLKKVLAEADSPVHHLLTENAVKSAIGFLYAFGFLKAEDLSSEVPFDVI